MSRRILAPVVALALATGCAGGAQGAVNELVEQVRLNDPLATQTYEQNREILESQEALPIWIEVIQEDPNSDVKLWAARILGNIGDPEAVPALTAALDSPKEVREEVANALQKIGEDHATGAFAEALPDASAGTQIFLLVELESLQDTDAIPAIVEVARGDSTFVAEAAATALGGLGDPAAAEPLRDLALDESLDPQVRQAAIRALGRLDAPEAAEAQQAVVEGLEGQQGAEELHTLAQETLQGG